MEYIKNKNIQIMHKKMLQNYLKHCNIKNYILLSFILLRGALCLNLRNGMKFINQSL